MKPTEEKIQEAADPFAEWKKEREVLSKFFKPQSGEKYDITLKSFEFGKRSFKEGEPPKWILTARTLSINGRLIDQEWTTSAVTIIKALEPYHTDQEALTRVIWRLKKTKRGDNTEYIFEDIGRVGGNPPQASKEAYI